MYGNGNPSSNPPISSNVPRRMKMLHDHRHPPVMFTGAWSKGERIPATQVVFPSYTRQPAWVAVVNPASQFGSGTQSSSVNASHSPRARRAPAFRFAAGPRRGPEPQLTHEYFSARNRSTVGSPSSVTITSYWSAGRV